MFSFKCVKTKINIKYYLMFISIECRYNYFFLVVKGLIIFKYTYAQVLNLNINSKHVDKQNISECI